jgi:hypothetical protein
MLMRFLHIASGTATASTIDAANLPGPRSIWADPLYEGPVPAGLDDDALLRVRARHLSDGSDDDNARNVDGLREWRRVIEARDTYDEVVLWFEHDLFDQLNLIQLLSWIRSRIGELRATLISIDSLLVDLRRGDTAALPFLARALTRFLQEYPWMHDGLSRSERRLLRLAESGPIDVAAAFPRMHDDEDAYYITDLSLAALVDALSQTSPPLVTIVRGAIDRGRSDGRAALAGTITLTDAGREVLAGSRDRVACGTDRWLGGVRVRTDEDVWRWDDDRGGIARR